jgi:UDP-glucose 4-epimerase
MKALVTGGTGLVGRYIVETLLDAGYEVAVAGRSPPADDLFPGPVAFRSATLDPDGTGLEMFDGIDAVIHAAFDHLPGRYRGGEGDDPERFRRINLDGSIRLFEAARHAGAKRFVFLSSRAVYDGVPPGNSPDGEPPVAANLALRRNQASGRAGAVQHSTRPASPPPACG